jgi:hypothetical protein
MMVSKEVLFLLNGFIIFIMMTFITACADNDNSMHAGSGSGSPGANSAHLSWTPPDVDEDGSALSGLAGYKVYYGRSQRTGEDPKICGMCGYEVSEDLDNVTTATISNLDSGTYYFAITSYDVFFNESHFTPERSKTIQ